MLGKSYLSNQSATIINRVKIRKPLLAELLLGCWGSLHPISFWRFSSIGPLHLLVFHLCFSLRYTTRDMNSVHSNLVWQPCNNDAPTAGMGMHGHHLSAIIGLLCTEGRIWSHFLFCETTVRPCRQISRSKNQISQDQTSSSGTKYWISSAKTFI